MPQNGDTKRTVAEVLAAYWRFAKSYYVKNGEPTDELVLPVISRPFSVCT